MEIKLMKHYIFSIYDSKAEAYLPPFFLHQMAMARRAFHDAVNNPESQINKHPADYTLFQIGTFDDDDGIIESTPPQTMGNGIEFVDNTTSPAQLDLVEETA
ncbi:nonstructural protein [Microviridae sp.]|nr:nonstructural protein [Microviridae sp.]